MAAEPFWEVELEGPEQEWVHRDAPGFWEREPGTNGPDDLGKPKKVVKAGYRSVTCQAKDKDAAVALALSREAHDGYTKVLGAKQLKRR